MPTGQQYATNVPQTTLTSGISASATTMSVASATGWPAAPFTATLDLGLSSQEPVDVTNVTGTTFTITRSVDSTSAFAHSNTATVTHTDIGRDFREARAHIDANGGNDSTGKAVHGLAGNVVGTTDAQTLTNKTISAGTYSGNQTMGSGTWTGTGTVQEAVVSFSGRTGAAASTTSLAGTVAIAGGGPPTTGTFVTGDVVLDTILNIQWICTSGGTPGTWAPMQSRVRIFHQDLTGVVGTGSVSVSSAVQTYFNHLVIEYHGKSTNSGGSGIDGVSIQLNGTTSANYNYEYETFLNGGAGAVFTSATTQTQLICGLVWSSHVATNGSGDGRVELPYALSSGLTHNVLWNSAASDGGALAQMGRGAGMLSTLTGVVTSLNFFLTTSGNFSSGTFSLYALV